MSSVIQIGSRREFCWDDYLFDTAATTAELKLHKPQAREVVIDHDEPWEGDGCDFHCIVCDDDGLLRMYYLGWETTTPVITTIVTSPIVVCYAESRNGIDWVKPKLGLCEFAGSRDNNIILDSSTGRLDNFFVFKDTKPDCPAEERYKGIAMDTNETDRYLWCFVSADGIRFEKKWPMTRLGEFDTLNTALWDRHSGRYLCYIRDYHDVPADDLNEGIRDIRWMASEDFCHWTTPALLDFGDGDDYSLYTNVIQPYYRGDHMLIGFPSRYVERKVWTPNYDELPGAARRRKRMERQSRYGLVVTDTVFMSSRDGARWRRWDEAFLTPGIEREYNWVYGDCYLTCGMVETESALPDAPKELSLYAFDNHWGGIPAQLRRYTIRVDGFVSYHAGYRPGKLVSKPFVFAGKSMSVNFATSAIGYLRIKLTGGGRTLESCELFGDSLERTVGFTHGDVGLLSGLPVTMEIEMRDADLYAFRFS